MRLVVGADAGVVTGVLERLGDEDVVVLDDSAGRLTALFDELADPRVWFLVGDADVIPLPDGSADEVVGAAASPEVARVAR
jgi:ubiquinone/menaquinone biosynthesis C-methylase UbiE